MALFAYTGDGERSVGATTCIIAIDNNPGVFSFDNDAAQTTIYYRIKNATNSALTTGVTYTASKNDVAYAFLSGQAFTHDITVTGLTVATPYWYKLQYSTDDASWFDAGGSAGTYTTVAGSAPTANFAVQSASMTSGTAIHQVRFVDSATNTPTSWEYNFGDGGTTATGSNCWKAYYTAGTYTVTQTVTNAYGSSSSVRNSYITVLSGAPVAAFTRTPTSGVRPLSVIFTESSTPAASLTGWKWELPDGIGTPTYDYADGVLKVYSVAGTYAATHTVTNILGSSSVVVTNAVTVKPISVGATFTAGPLSGPPPLSVIFTGTPSGDSTGVLWNFGDGATTTEANPTHAYTSVAAFTPTYTVYGTTAAGGATTSVSTATGTSLISVALDATYKVLLEELRKQLLMNTDVGTVCTDFVEWGGVTTILRYIYNRICRIQLEAGPLRKTSTTITATAPGVLTLPADLIEIRSIYVNGNRLEKTDARMGDVSDQDWQNSPAGDYKGWFTNPGNHLTLNLVPAITPSTFEVYYVNAPAEPTVPGGCTGWDTLPVPYVYWWIVKYGVLADMLNHEGEMYDIERAKLCEQMFAEGIELIKLSLEGK